MLEKEPGLPGSAIVGQFGEEIRNAINTGITTGVSDARRAFAWWSIAILVGTIIASAAVSWLVVARVLSEPNEGSFTIHHATGVTEVCTKGADSTPVHEVVACHYPPPPPH